VVVLLQIVVFVGYDAVLLGENFVALSRILGCQTLKMKAL
jgi:hypothetical protein